MKTVVLVVSAFLFTASVAAQTITLRGNWKFKIGDQAKWAEPGFDDAAWEVVFAPAAWEDEGFHGYDGFAWYRKSFDGKKLSPEYTYYLSLGYIDDCDEVYLNGTLIGLSGSMPPKFKTAYNSERKYSLPTDLINFNGENVLAIRVFDTTLAGGIVDGPLGIFRNTNNRMLLDLQGLWQFYRTSNSNPVIEDAEWKQIMVPSPWEHQGYPKYDGYAWYKRTFKLPTTINLNDKLVLILGKIDDFDKTFLNGKLIGKTNDGEEYGRSQSFSQLRVYSIPAGLLKKNGLNTIEVFVDDMGNVGGIYEGPVGITTRTNYERYYKKSSDFFFWNE